MGKGILSAEYEKISTPGECATLCNSMHVTKCLSFNYDFGSSGHCELLEVIEGQDYKTSVVCFIFLLNIDMLACPYDNL